MVRTQIQITEEQARLLKAMAAEESVSIAELIRRSIDGYVRGQKQASPAERRRQALAVAGKYASDPNDISLTHDDYLADIYGEVGP